MFFVIDILLQFLTACETLLSISVDFASFPRKNDQENRDQNTRHQTIKIFQAKVSDNAAKRQKNVLTIEIF